MNYKCLLLSTLFASVVVADSDFFNADLLITMLHVQNPTSAQHKKLQELSAISAEMVSKQELIDSLFLQVEPIIESFKGENEQLADDYFENFSQKIDKAFHENGDIKGLLAEDFSVVDNVKYNLNFVKNVFIRICVERLLIVGLTHRYEKCLQELINLGK